MKEVGLYIPCYNAAETVGLCIEAAMKQTYPPKAIFVVDDASTDDSIKIVSGYPVRLIRHKENSGLASVRNTAIKSIDTEFIASLDADCVAQQDWLEAMMIGFVSPKIAGVGGRLLEDNTSSVFNLWRATHMCQDWGSEKVNPWFLFGANTVFSRRALLNVGLYDETYNNNYEDVDLCDKLKKKRYKLVYEPEARVRHLKNDDIRSILNNYWAWQMPYYKKMGYYSNARKLSFKIKDNIGLANRYLEEDVNSQRLQLLYLDFLLSIHHCLKDFEYLTFKDSNTRFSYRPLDYFISMFDLTLFYHLDSRKRSISTLIPKQIRHLQNFFALILIVSDVIYSKFKRSEFHKSLYGHLMMSVYGVCEENLLNKMLNLTYLRKDWNGFLEKKQPNLNRVFLKTICQEMKKWFHNIEYSSPEVFGPINGSEIFGMIDASSQDKDYSLL